MFSELSKGIQPNSPQMDWEALNYIFLDQKFPSVIISFFFGGGGGFENNAF